MVRFPEDFGWFRAGDVVRLVPRALGLCAVLLTLAGCPLPPPDADGQPVASLSTPSFSA